MIRLTIKTSNAAFQGAGKEFEVARIIEEAAGKIEGGRFDFKLFDFNGNSGTLVDGDRPSKDAADWEKVGAYPDGVVADKMAKNLGDQGHFSLILSVGEYSPELRYVLNHFSPSVEVYFKAHPNKTVAQPAQSLYAALKAAGIEIGNHESDLYVPVTSESTAILAKYPTNKANATTFKSNIDGVLNTIFRLLMSRFMSG